MLLNEKWFNEKDKPKNNNIEKKPEVIYNIA